MSLFKSIVGLLNRNQHKEVTPKVVERKGVVLKLKQKVREQIQQARNRAERRKVFRGYGYSGHPLHARHFGNFSPLRPIPRLHPDRFGRLCLSEKKWKRVKQS